MLNFKRLREVNVKRCSESFHGLDSWSPSDWATAFGGEAGEALNMVKKLRRHFQGTNFDKDPKTTTEIINLIGNELADAILYADLLAARLNIDLEDAIIRKFNSVSIEKKSQYML